MTHFPRVGLEGGKALTTAQTCFGTVGKSHGDDFLGEIWLLQTTYLRLESVNTPSTSGIRQSNEQTICKSLSVFLQATAAAFNPPRAGIL